MSTDNFLKIKVFFSCGRTELTIIRGSETSFTTSFIHSHNKNVKSDLDVLHMLKVLSERLKKKFKKEYIYSYEQQQVTFNFGTEKMDFKRLHSKTLITYIDKFVKSYK